MKKRHIIILFIFLITITSLVTSSENSINDTLQNQNTSTDFLYSQYVYICYPYNLTNQSSLGDCLTYTIYGLDNLSEALDYSYIYEEELNIYWLDKGFSLHLIFHNESFDLGIANISYDEYVDIRDKVVDYLIETNSSGQTEENTFYLPFGEVLSGGSERFGYTGKELDTETNLNYYGARYYDSYFMHFTQADSLLPDIYDPQQLNRYSYVRNNPYKYVDESGNQFDPVSWTVAVVTAGVLIYYTGTAIIAIIQDPSTENAIKQAEKVIDEFVKSISPFGVIEKIESEEEDGLNIEIEIEEDDYIPKINIDLTPIGGGNILDSQQEKEGGGESFSPYFEWKNPRQNVLDFSSKGRIDTRQETNGIGGGSISNKEKEQKEKPKEEKMWWKFWE